MVFGWLRGFWCFLVDFVFLFLAFSCFKVVSLGLIFCCFLVFGCLYLGFRFVLRGFDGLWFWFVLFSLFC